MRRRDFIKFDWRCSGRLAARNARTTAGEAGDRHPPQSNASFRRLYRPSPKHEAGKEGGWGWRPQSQWDAI